MNNNYVIIDNFLSSENSKLIKNSLCAEDFEWNFKSGITKDVDDPINIHNDRLDIFQKQLRGYEKDDYYFNHFFFNNTPFFMSQRISLMHPILRQLKIDFLYRIKANFYTRTEKNVEHDWHVDFEEEHFSAIYYVNTNNGKTLLKDIGEIESIENRMLIFKGNSLHASTSATDTYRININFNFTRNYEIEKMSVKKKNNNISYN